MHMSESLDKNVLNSFLTQTNTFLSNDSDMCIGQKKIVIFIYESTAITPHFSVRGRYLVFLQAI